MANHEPEAMSFRNQLDALSLKFVDDYKRRDPTACAEAYTEDASLLISDTSLIRGRIEIAAAIQAAMDTGQDVLELITVESDADGRFGYAIQTVRGSNGDETVLLALRREDDGFWLVLSEAIVRRPK